MGLIILFTILFCFIAMRLLAVGCGFPQPFGEVLTALYALIVTLYAVCFLASN